MPEERRFEYAVDRRFAPLLLLFGFRAARDQVVLSDTAFSARLGFCRVSTPLANIDGAHVTRDYRWWTAVGVRASLADDGLTFGTNRDAGVCVHFREKVPSPLRRSGHSALTVTVGDLDGLVRALASGGA